MTGDDIRGMVENLEARLLAGDTHEEREAWVMLIRSLMIINETERRDAALAHYLTLDLDEPADSATIINMAEVMLPPDNLPVIIPDVLIALIDKARELTPDQPSVLFFSGLMARQQGDREALAAWSSRMIRDGGCGGECGNRWLKMTTRSPPCSMPSLRPPANDHGLEGVRQLATSGLPAEIRI